MVAADIFDEETGEVIAECNDDVSAELLEKLREAGIKSFEILFIDNLNVGAYLRNTINAELNERRRSWTGRRPGDGHRR